MDSKTTFGVIVVLLGIVGVWLAFTGKLKQIIAAAQQPAPPTGFQNAAGQAAPTSGAGGSFAPTSTTSPSTQLSGNPTSTPAIGVQQQFGTPATLLAYQNPIGNDGAALLPIGSVTFGAYG